MIVSPKRKVVSSSLAGGANSKTKVLDMRNTWCYHSPIILYCKGIWAERVAKKDTAESCRWVQDNSKGFGEVHSASCVLKPSRHNGFDRYIV